MALTEEDIFCLKSVVPSTVKARFDPNLTFGQQTAEEKSMATLYLERKVPALRKAEKHWAALSLLAHTAHTLQATKVRKVRRQALVRLLAKERRTERLHNMDEEMRDARSGPAADNLVFFLEHRRTRAGLS